MALSSERNERDRQAEAATTKGPAERFTGDWHGALPNHFMTHLATSAAVDPASGSTPGWAIRELKVHHLSDAVAALDVRLTEDETRRLEEHYVPHIPRSYT